jgi:hypothetical protein
MLASKNLSPCPTYDVSPDGEEFVVLEPPPEDEVAVRVVQNWYEEFRDRGQ